MKLIIKHDEDMYIEPPPLSFMRDYSPGCFTKILSIQFYLKNRFSLIAIHKTLNILILSLRCLHVRGRCPPHSVVCTSPRHYAQVPLETIGNLYSRTQLSDQVPYWLNIEHCAIFLFYPKPLTIWHRRILCQGGLSFI